MFCRILHEAFSADWPKDQVGSDKFVFKGRMIKYIHPNNLGEKVLIILLIRKLQNPAN